MRLTELNSAGEVIRTFEVPDDSPLVRALQPNAEHHTREEWARLTVRDRIKQVILNFNWSDYRVDGVGILVKDEGMQEWAEHLANAVQVHLNGDLHEVRNELGQVAEIAEAAQRHGEQIDPGRVLDIVGWPMKAAARSRQRIGKPLPVIRSEERSDGVHATVHIPAGHPAHDVVRSERRRGWSIES